MADSQTSIKSSLRVPGWTGTFNNWILAPGVMAIVAMLPDHNVIRHRRRIQAEIDMKIAKHTSPNISGELKSWLKQQDIEHTRGAPYHPMTQGKIERYHRSMKNVVKLEHYYYPWELEKAIQEWVHHYNHERYHESLDNVTPADVFEGRRNEILDQRALVKARTMTQRKIHNLRLAG